jgi:hypothetical protein
LPRFVENEAEVTPGLLDVPLYAKMEDAELVLRFFALRHAEHYRNGMQGFLDLYMRKAMSFSEADIDVLEREFTDTLELASRVFGDELFRPYDTTKGSWAPKAQKAYYDAVMVGLSKFLDRAEAVTVRSAAVRDEVARMFSSHEEGTFTGRGNTKRDIEERISLFEGAIERAIA